MNLSKIQGFVAVVLGLAFIEFGLLQQRKKKKLLTEGIEAEGEIFDVVGDSKQMSGRPIIRFVTKEQVVVSEQYKITVPFNKKGQKVLLVYDAQNPKEFIVKKIL